MGKIKSKICRIGDTVLEFSLYLLQIFLILMWTIYLCRHTDSLPSIYFLCAFCSVFILLSLVLWKKYKLQQSRILFPLVSIIFGLAVCAANYQIIHSASWFMTLWIGGFCVANICLNGLYFWTELYLAKYGDVIYIPSKRKTRRLFFSCFVLICIINMAYLFLFRYPGCMNSDGIIQVTNGLYDIRANHFPYVHTLLLLVFLKAGLWISGGLNLGIALYCCFQIVFMAVCLSMAITTLYQSNIPRIFLIMAIIGYVFMPYNIAYSCMVWKDVLFGGAVLLFVTALYRIYCKVGRMLVNYILFAVGGVGFALLRNNGWYALFLTFVVILILRLKKMKYASVIIFIVLGSTWILTHPVYKMLGVAPSEFTESLSIPIQQIARTVTDGGEITVPQWEAINELIDIETIPEKYSPGWSDPIKFSIDYEQLDGQEKRYFKVWFDIGLHNPASYIKAWIDQTKGYWNGGYEFWIWYTTIDENWFEGYGSIFQTVVFERGAKIVDYFMNLFMKLPVFDIFRSIGFAVWGLIMCLAFALKRKDYLMVVLTIPVIGTVLTLWVATPVFSEFRYAYAVFTCLPFLFLLTMRKVKEYF
mgnify:FL=1